MSFEQSCLRAFAIVGLAGTALTMSVGCASQSPDASNTGTTDLAVDDDALAACPTSPPVNGSSCTSNGLGCTYGDDARFGCRTQAICNKDTGKKLWEVATADCPNPKPSCPGHAPIEASSDSNACGDKDLGLTCVYSSRAYTCTPCSGTLCFQQNSWSIMDLDPQCPMTVPNLGAACNTPHLFCNYNVCADDQIPPNQWAYGIGERCEQGQWQYYGGKQVCL